MKKFVITEEERKQIKSLYEDKFLMESDSINFLVRRWNSFKKIFDREFEFSAICHFKVNDDLNGYLKHVSGTIARSMFLQEVDFLKATQEDLDKYVRVASAAILDNFKDEIEKYYNLKEC
jgi:hypothetical protein